MEQFFQVTGSLIGIEDIESEKQSRSNISRELVNFLATHHVSQKIFLGSGTLQIVTDNLALAWATFSGKHLSKFFIDRSLSSKYTTESIASVVVLSQGLAVTYSDRTRVDHLFFKRSLYSSPVEKKQLITDLKVFSINLPIPHSRNAERKIAVNSAGDLILVWWSTGDTAAQPWLPSNESHHCLHILSVRQNSGELRYICSSKSEFDVVFSSFSKVIPNEVLTIEQSPGPNKQIYCHICKYLFSNGNQLILGSTTSISVRAPIISWKSNDSETKFLVGTADNFLVSFDSRTNYSNKISLDILPEMLDFHCTDTLIVSANAQGYIQLLDAALQPIKCCFCEEKPEPCFSLRSLFRLPPVLSYITWLPKSIAHDSLFLLFSGGPVSFVRIHTYQILNNSLSVQHLIRMNFAGNQFSRAVNLLRTLDWSTESRDYLRCVLLVFNELLKQPLSPLSEDLLEKVLGYFYSPPKPIADDVVLENREVMITFVRRFFFHLLRHSRFEKAYLLAVDVGAPDLFMDLFYAASDAGEQQLADVCKSKALQLRYLVDGSETDSVPDPHLPPPIQPPHLPPRPQEGLPPISSIERAMEMRSHIDNRNRLPPDINALFESLQTTNYSEGDGAGLEVNDSEEVDDSLEVIQLGLV